MVKGTYHFPTTIGHEFAGQIVDCGDKVKNNLTVGDRVSVMPLIPCGECQYCKVDSPTSAITMITMDQEEMVPWQNM